MLALYILSLIAGFALLTWSADRFVLGSANFARLMGVSPLMIGITVVGFGTSAPEILVSGIAAWQGNPGLAIGNAIGSNITNIALIVGVTAIIIPMTARPAIVRREIPMLLAVSLFAVVLMLDYELSRWEGVLFAVTQIALLGWTAWIGKREKQQLFNESELDDNPMSLNRSLFWLILGLLLLLGSSRLLVWSAVGIATAAGIPPLVIGLTVIALGTSLPELAACIVSCRKGHDDIAIGNILGSNTFNLMSVLGIASLIQPTSFEQIVVYRDLPLMLFLSLLLGIFAFKRQGSAKISRIKGTILLSIYITYQAWLYLTMTQGV